MKRLASVDELNSPQFREFMSWINGFAQVHGLRMHANWSKVWEYPWVWSRISTMILTRARVLDLGSEISPMPWFFSSLGAEVMMIEIDGTHVPKWMELNARHGFGVRWKLVSGSELPFEDERFDCVTSYSVLEHMRDKEAAVQEAIRVLRPGGLFCLTFDICEASMGMSYPDWNGCALEMRDFDRLIWNHPDLEPGVPRAEWNIEDIDAFLNWHRQTAPHHNYIVGGAVLRKKGRGLLGISKCRGTKNVLRAHQLDTGLGSGNTGDDAMFLAAHAHLPPGLELITEVHSLERTSLLPENVRYILAQDEEGIRQSLRDADLALLIGDTPIMDAWGLEWPLLANSRKLDLCHRAGIPVHCVGVGVDRLSNPAGLDIFRDYYLPITSWSVRSEQCRQALMAMGVPDEKILVGADWAWLLPRSIDPDWAERHLFNFGYEPGGIHIGVNLVNEIWHADTHTKHVWAGLLDRLAEKHDAQIFFFCNESRTGDYFDRAAAEQVRIEMKHPSALVADRYFTPAEMLSLISLMEITISQRYHFTLFSALVDIYPISVQRGQKMKSLNDDLGLRFVGDMNQPAEDAIIEEVDEALGNGENKRALMRTRRDLLRRRALENFSLVRL